MSCLESQYAEGVVMSTVAAAPVATDSTWLVESKLKPIASPAVLTLNGMFEPPGAPPAP
jgi:hypothetical protein